MPRNARGIFIAQNTGEENLTQRKSPGGNRGSSADDANNSTPAFDDFEYDKQVVDGVGRSLWVALFNGAFRLAVQCDTCGRWLTSTTSKRAHRGPRCAAKVGESE
jgi:hypothetical protein